MRKVTFDLETKNFFQDVGTNNPADLDISVLCIHDSKSDEYSSFLEKDFSKLWSILENADMLITWNGDHFDIPLLNKYYPGDLTKIKSLDLMKEVQNVLGRRLKLNTVAEATLGIGKSGNGIEAVEWWRSGEIDKIIEYCIDDVRITKQLYDFAIQNKYLRYRDFGVVKEIKLDTSSWKIPKNNSMTYTLPF